jgi:hypothetical protein
MKHKRAVPYDVQQPPSMIAVIFVLPDNLHSFALDLAHLQVLPGEYAFVLHTASPFSGARGEMYGEMVCGLGETLVGNHPGRPLAFSDKPDGSEMQLLALPSKRQGLFVPAGGTLIARSDTNGEDLVGYAGAGLYDRCVCWG